MLASMTRVIVFVGDVEKCASFFRDAFELETIESTHAPNQWCELDAGGCRLAFHKAHGPDGPIDTPTGGPNNPHKIVFHADDLPATRQKLVDRGVDMGDVQSVGDVSICDGHDPEGHRFQLCSH